MHLSPRPLAVAAGVFLAAGTLTAVAAPAHADTSPNGVLAYSAWDEDLNYDIYTFDPATPDVAPLRLTTDGQYNGNADWSPDGTEIVYDGWGTTGGPRIRVMDTDPATDDHVGLTEPCTDFDCYGDFQPAWSPDGTRIAFVSSRPQLDGTPHWTYELYVMDATGEAGALPAATRLTNDPQEDTGYSIQDSQVTWSPDGLRVAWVAQGRGEERDACDIWSMDSRDLDGDGFGDNMQRLTFDDSFLCSAFEDMTPAWSPDSSLIAFASTRTGSSDIWLVNAEDPTDLRNVTAAVSGYADQPSWSPDGTQIIFRSDQSGAYEFYSLPVPPPTESAEAAAPRPVKLTSDGVDKSGADWGALAGSQRGTQTLTVGAHRNGTVASTDLTKINCGKDCAATFVSGSRVQLSAAPRPGYVFVKWLGACRGTAPTCVVRLGKSKAIGAKFAPAP